MYELIEKSIPAIKKVVLEIVVFLLVLFPKSTGLISMYQQITNTSTIAAEKITAAFESKDVDALEELMCLNIKENVEDLRGKIGQMYNSIDGEIIEITVNMLGGSYDETHERGKSISQRGINIFITTTTGYYFVCICWEYINTFQPEETGIRNIGISKSDHVGPIEENLFTTIMIICATEGISEWHE